ncbi:MAG: hypothetical protein WAW34_17000 [Rhodoferax sp.]
MGMVWIVIVGQALAIGWFCSYIAGQKNRDTGSWFWLGFLFSFMALIAIAAVPAEKEVQRSFETDAGERKCPFCAEVVKREAVICRFCQRDLPPAAAVSQSTETPIGLATASPILSEGDQTTIDELRRQEAAKAQDAAYQASIQAALADQSGVALNSFGSDGRTPLMSAIHRNDLDSVRRLLSAGAKTNQLWKDPKNGDYVSIKDLAKRADANIARLFA